MFQQCADLLHHYWVGQGNMVRYSREKSIYLGAKSVFPLTFPVCMMQGCCHHGSKAQPHDDPRNKTEDPRLIEN